MVTIRARTKAWACTVVLLAFIGVGLVLWRGLGWSSPTGTKGAGPGGARGLSPFPATTANARPAGQPSSQTALDEANVEDIGLPADVQAVARWFGANQKEIGDAKIVWQAREDQYIDFLKKESFVEGLQRSHICSELIHVRADFDVLDPDNPGIIATLAKSRRFSKLLAYIGES